MRAPREKREEKKVFSSAKFFSSFSRLYFSAAEKCMTRARKFMRAARISRARAETMSARRGQKVCVRIIVLLHRNSSRLIDAPRNNDEIARRLLIDFSRALTRSRR